MGWHLKDDGLVSVKGLWCSCRGRFHIAPSFVILTKPTGDEKICLTFCIDTKVVGAIPVHGFTRIHSNIT